ncbi:MAG: radical SAM protein [Candidatus Omnitrophica bacterium]|nr:radical SAM protein [Candidatus Omnitrophota bacterium]
MVDQHSELRLVFWETTAACNLECSHCRRLEISRELSKEDLTTEEGLYLIDELSRMGILTLVFSGGEPLIRPDLFKLALHAHAKGLRTALASNGTLIDEEMAREILYSGVQRVAISLDGADAKTHDGFRRQEGSFQKAVNAFHILRRKGMSLQMNCTLARHNIYQKEEIYDLALTLGIDALHIFMLVPVGCGASLSSQVILSAEEYEEVLGWLYEKSKRACPHVRATCAPHYFRVIHQRAKAEGRRLDLRKSGMSSMTKGCLAGTGVVFISHKGEIFPCGYLPLVCGNVREKPFREIWCTSAILNQLRVPEFLEGKCGICEYRNICLGCRARAYSQDGNYLGPEPLCLYQPKRAFAEFQT